MGDGWLTLAWFIVGGFVALLVLGFILWAVIAAKVVKKSREFRADFDKGFESDFFKRSGFLTS